MIKYCNDFTYITQIKKYIGENYTLSPYLYNNLEAYGLTNNNVEVWIDINNKIYAIYLRYFTTLHIFSQESNLDEIVQNCIDGQLGFIPSVIMVGTNNTDNLDKLSSVKYKLDKEWIYEKHTKHEILSPYSVSIAKRTELMDIAKLMMSSKLYQEIYKSTIELEEQLAERFDAGYGECFVIKINGAIVASCSINANNLKFAIIGGIIVKDEYRRKGLGSAVSNYAWNSILAKNEKKVIDLVSVHNKASVQLHETNGFKKVGIIYKYTIRRDVQND